MTQETFECPYKTERFHGPYWIHEQNPCVVMGFAVKKTASGDVLFPAPVLSAAGLHEHEEDNKSEAYRICEILNDNHYGSGEL